MENAKNIINYLRAGYSCFWVRTTEPRRAYQNLNKLISEYQRNDDGKYKVSFWDCLSGNPADIVTDTSKNEFTVSIAINFHWFIDKPPIIQTISNNIEKWRSLGSAFIVVSPKQNIPIELLPDFVVMEYELPEETEISASIERIVSSAEGVVTMPDEKDLNDLVNASKGLTQDEVENVLSLSVVENGNLDASKISKSKSNIIEREGLLEVVDSDLTFDDIKGYGNIKDFVLKMQSKDTAKGIIIIGPPGCGKTLFMKCLAGSSGKLALSVDIGKLFSKYQGETDQNITQAINTIKAVGSCIVMIDEFEKQFAGAGSSGDTDSGVTRRATSKWLEFMQNRPKGIYFIATCNSFDGIPAEYLRPGRWDCSPFFIDLPSDEEKEMILDYHARKRNITLDNDYPDMEEWTGAEIESCCHIGKKHQLLSYLKQKQWQRKLEP